MTSQASLSRSVSGLIVLVTGAASGMGRATAQVFAQEGAKVVVTDVNAEQAEAVAHDIRQQGGQARAWALDVSDPQAIKQVVDEAAAHFGGLDAVVNNAGISVHVNIDDPDYEARMEQAMAVLLTAHPRIIRAALPSLRRSYSPRHVNMSTPAPNGTT